MNIYLEQNELGEGPAYIHLEPHELDKVTTLAINALNSLNPVSIDEDRLYCGYIGLDEHSQIQITQATRGTLDNCDPALPDNWILIASYHTNGAVNAEYNSEYPSSADLLADQEQGLIGYTSTPGGRVWIIDGQALTAELICTEGCVSYDASYPGKAEAVTSPVNYQFLLQLEETGRANQEVI